MSDDAVRPGRTPGFGVFKQKREQIWSKDFFMASYVLIESAVLSLSFILLGYGLAGDGIFDLKNISFALLTTFVYSLFVVFRANTDLTGLEIVSIERRLKYWTASVVCFVLIAFMFKITGVFSRIWISSTFLLGCFLIAVMQRGANFYLKSLIAQRKVASRAVIYGGTQRTHSLITGLKGALPALDILGVIDVRGSRFDKAEIECHRGVPLDDLVELVREAGINSILIDLPWSAETRIGQIKRAFEAIDVDVLLAPYHMELADDGYDIVTLGHLKALSLYKRPTRGLPYFVKTIADRIGALLLLLPCAPILLLTALAIKLESRGPVLFKQQRQGFNNKPFSMLKFRSMYTDDCDANGVKSTLRDDPRVTRVGKIIRGLSIDELPQLINVVIGDMSLVGPRPHAFGSTAGNKKFEEIVERYAARHRMLPGMTGLAQVRGFRGNTDTEDKLLKRVESDLEYIRRWSLTLDLEILLRTILVVIFPKNAF